MKKIIYLMLLTSSVVMANKDELNEKSRGSQNLMSVAEINKQVLGINVNQDLAKTAFLIMRDHTGKYTEDQKNAAQAYINKNNADKRGKSLYGKVETYLINPFQTYLINPVVDFLKEIKTTVKQFQKKAQNFSWNPLSWF